MTNYKLTSVKILLAISLPLLATLPSKAQIPIGVGQALGLNFTANTAFSTNYITPGGISNAPGVVDCSKFRQVTFQITYAGDAVGGANEGLVLHYKPSVDGVTFSSASTPIVLPVIGVTNRTIVTNLDSFGATAIKIGISNAAGTANITNLAVFYGVKISAQ